MSEQQEQRDYEALNADTALRLNKAQQRITAMEAEIKESDSYHNGEHLKDANRINALEATIKAADELADKWENDETLGREREGIICADLLRKLLRSKDNG